MAASVTGSVDVPEYLLFVVEAPSERLSLERHPLLRHVAPFLLLRALDARDEGELLVVVRRDDMGVPRGPLGNVIVGGLTGRCLDNDDVLVVADTEQLLVVSAKARSRLQPPLLERLHDIPERTPVDDVGHSDLLGIRTHSCLVIHVTLWSGDGFASEPVYRVRYRLIGIRSDEARPLVTLSLSVSRVGTADCWWLEQTGIIRRSGEYL